MKTITARNARGPGRHLWAVQTSARGCSIVYLKPAARFSVMPPEMARPFATVPLRGEQRSSSARSDPVRAEITSQEAAEERRLWADYYEAVMAVLETIRGEGTNGAAVMRVLAQHAVASAALARIREIRGLD
jgi:hypothetical protein